MTVDDHIDTAFEKLINQRGIHKMLGISSQLVRNYRVLLKSGKPISGKLKRELLEKAELLNQVVASALKDERLESVYKYTREDLVDLVRWYNLEGIKHEPDYAVHKWKLQRGKGLAEHVNNPAAELAKKVRDGR